MRRRLFLLGAAGALAAPMIVAPLLLRPGANAPPLPEPPVIDPAEHARTIAAMKPPKRARPVIAIFALNAATEVTDLLAPFNVLMRAAVADVFIVAERAAPVPLYPFSRFGRGQALFSVDPQLTTAEFDERWPDGADHVVVPAIEPRDDPFATTWIGAQHGSGATIVSVCAGALTLGAAGLLGGRRATTHWAYVEELRRDHPTMQWARNRRYVADEGIITSTGISASIPVSIALVEAIAGHGRAHEVASELGVEHWDERHDSAAFQLTTERKKTFLRNWLSFWRRETLGLPVTEGVDEIALAFTADLWSRTSLSGVATWAAAGAVQSLHRLTIRPMHAAPIGQMLSPSSPQRPAETAKRDLERIAARFGERTADIVALALEYPWPPPLA